MLRKSNGGTEQKKHYPLRFGCQPVGNTSTHNTLASWFFEVAAPQRRPEGAKGQSTTVVFPQQGHHIAHHELRKLRSRLVDRTTGRYQSASLQRCEGPIGAARFAAAHGGAGRSSQGDQFKRKTIFGGAAKSPLARRGYSKKQAMFVDVSLGPIAENA